MRQRYSDSALATGSLVGYPFITEEAEHESRHFGRPRLPEFATLVIGALYFIALSAFAAFLGTWTDEEYTLSTTAHGFVYAWQRAIDYELQAPLYFAFLAVWRGVNASVWFARFFSIICATGFYFALGPILQRISPRARTFWPALAIALNPFVIYCALDIRLYAPALLLSALGWLAFDAGFVSGSSFRARASFAVISVVSLYTQYFLGFALVGYAVVLAVTRRWRTLGPYAVTLVPIVLAALPLLEIVRSQIGGSGETSASTTTLLRQTLLHPWLDFVLPYDLNWTSVTVRASYLTLAVLLVAIILAAFVRLPRTDASAGRFGAAFSCALTIELLFVGVVLFFRLDLNVRHFAVLFTPTMIAGYALVVTLGNKPTPQIGRLLRSIYVVLTVAVLYSQQHQVAQVGDSKRIAAYLQAHAAPNAIVAVFPADALPVYARQYRGTARLVPFPKPLPAKRYDIGAIDVQGEGEARVSLAHLPKSSQVWLVMLGACDIWVRSYGCDHVLKAIKDGADVVSERRFYDSRVFALGIRR